MDENTAKAIEQRGLVTQARLSSIFGEWLRPTSPTINRHSDITIHENRMSVSEPKLAPASRIIERSDSSDPSEDDRDDFESAFEEMMVIDRLRCPTIILSDEYY